MSRSRGAANVAPASSTPTCASAGGSRKTAGGLGADTWLRARGATPPTVGRWYVEIALDVVNGRAPSEFDEATSTRFHLDIYADEWGVFFCHGGHSSWIRVTDIAFVHGRDEFGLLSSIPALKDIGQLLRQLERGHRIQLQREHAHVRTNVPGIEPAVRAWIATL